MPDLQDGETTEMQGSGAKPYVLKNTGGVYSCSCPAWRNQSILTVHHDSQGGIMRVDPSIGLAERPEMAGAETPPLRLVA